MILIMVVSVITLSAGCQLSAPSSPKLSYDDNSGVVYWNKVLFASDYEVTVVDSETGQTIAETTTSATQYAITEYGVFIVTVIAVSKRGESLPSSISVTRVNTQTDAIVDWQVNGAAILAEMPAIPFYLNYYYPGCGELSVPLNSDLPPTQIAGDMFGVLVPTEEWRFENGCIIISENTLDALDPGQYEVFRVALSDGTIESFRVDRTEEAAVRVALYSAASDGSVEIAVVPAPVSVLLEGNEIDWKYEEGNVVVAAFEQYSDDVTLELTMVFEDGFELSQFVLVSDNAAKTLSLGGGACIGYDKTDGGDIVIGLGNSERSGNAAYDSRYYRLAVDGKLIEVGSSYDDDAKFGINRDTLTIYEEYLQTLTRGVHKLEIFTRDGVATAYIYVYSRNLMCYDLDFDFDESWPDIVLEYECDAYVDELIVVVDGVEYSSKEHPEMFEKGRIILTDKIQKNDPVSIKSVYDGQEASSETVTFAVDTDELEKYLDPSQGYTWLGEEVNLYIDSIEELDMLAQYMLLYYDELETETFLIEGGGTPTETEMHCITAYFDFSELGFSRSQLLTKLVAADGAFSSYKEAYKLKAAIKPCDSAEENMIGVLLRSATEPSIAPSDRDGFVKYTENDSNVFHLTRSDRGSNFDDFPIDDRVQTAVVTTSDQLFFAVEQGYRPEPVPGSAAERIYEKALDVCRTYIDDDMSELEKVHVIYDWLGKNVVYDYSATDEMRGISTGSDEYNKFYRYNCFFLEGVFDDGVAVCNGIAKAVSLLCGIEDITCLKAGGSSRGEKHAWNKVYVDGVWYIVDSTWSNERNFGSNAESFTHDYLLMSTPQAASNHNEDTADTLPYYASDGERNYFVEMSFRYGDYAGNYYISDAEELRRLVNYAKSEEIAEFNVFCASLADMEEFESDMSDAGVTIQPCCPHFADEDRNIQCDRCRSGNGFKITIG